jgi:hypothetical protein
MLMDLFRLNSCIGHPFPAQLLRILFWYGENKVTAHARSGVLETVLMKIKVFWNVKPHRLLNMWFLKLWCCEDACQSEQTYPSSTLILGLRRAVGQRYSYRRSTWRYIPQDLLYHPNRRIFHFQETKTYYKTHFARRQKKNGFVFENTI